MREEYAGTCAEYWENLSSQDDDTKITILDSLGSYKINETEH